MFPELDIKVLARVGIGDLQFIPRVSLKSSNFVQSFCIWNIARRCGAVL